VRRLWEGVEDGGDIGEEEVRDVFDSLRSEYAFVSDEVVEAADNMLEILSTALSPRHCRRILSRDPRYDGSGFQQQVAYAYDMIRREGRERVDDAIPLLQGTRDAMKALLASHRKTVCDEEYRIDARVPSRLDAALGEIEFIEDQIVKKLADRHDRIVLTN
jgi:hypothetical protein